MSVVPLMFRDWWDDFERPMSRLMDQHFGSGLNRDDLLSGLSSLNIASRPRSIFGSPAYYRPWRHLVRQNSGGASTISCDKERFEVRFFYFSFQRTWTKIFLCGCLGRLWYRDILVSDIISWFNDSDAALTRKRHLCSMVRKHAQNYNKIKHIYLFCRIYRETLLLLRRV